MFFIREFEEFRGARKHVNTAVHQGDHVGVWPHLGDLAHPNGAAHTATRTAQDEELVKLWVLPLDCLNEVLS